MSATFPYQKKRQRVLGLEMAYVDEGQGDPIVFLHGVSQCWLQWTRQMNSSLAKDHRLVALDMRGHGLSDKPRDAYGDSKLWADDINAVIEHRHDCGRACHGDAPPLHRPHVFSRGLTGEVTHVVEMPLIERNNWQRSSPELRNEVGDREDNVVVPFGEFVRCRD